MIDKTKVLFLAINQMGLVYTRLGDEVRGIRQSSRIGSLRDLLELIPESSVRVSDLSDILLEHSPHVVHFSGHAEPSEGMILQNDAQEKAPLGVVELTDTLRILKDNIRLIFLNVCHSKPYAESLVQVFDYAIGMNGTFKDEAAILFAAAFYRALAYGRSIKQAYDIARDKLKMKYPDQSEVPVLLIRPEVDVSESFLLGQKTVENLKSAISRSLIENTDNAEWIRLGQEILAGTIIINEMETAGFSDSRRQEYIDVQARDGQLHVTLGFGADQNIKDRLFPVPPGIAPPFAPFAFIGRDNALSDIKQLLGVEKEISGGSNVTVVRGWPGIGKTTLVGVIGRDPAIAKRFSDGVLWTSLEQKPNLLSNMARWGKALGSDEIFRAPTLDEATIVLARLLRHRQMLLIVDDVWDTAHAVPFLEAVGKQCALLITTRMTAVAQEITTEETRNYILRELAKEDSLKLLAILVPTIVEQFEDECIQLADDLEHLPLALHVAGRLLKSEADMGWGVTDLIREIRQGTGLIEQRAPKDRIEGGEIPTVKALLTKSTNMLDDLTHNCFAYLGVFASKPASFDLAAMKAVWQIDDPRPIARRLVGHGLLEPTGTGRFQMHRILVDHAKSLRLK